MPWRFPNGLHWFESGRISSSVWTNWPSRQKEASPDSNIPWFDGTKTDRLSPKSRCAKLVTSFPRRREAVAVTKIASTNYWGKMNSSFLGFFAIYFLPKTKKYEKKMSKHLLTALWAYSCSCYVTGWFTDMFVLRHLYWQHKFACLSPGWPFEGPSDWNCVFGLYCIIYCLFLPDSPRSNDSSHIFDVWR